MSDCCASRPSGLARDAADAGSDSTLPSVTLRPGVTLPDWSAVSSPRTKEVLLALVQSDHVQHRWSGYSADADRVRSALLRIYAEVGRAPSLDALAARSEMDKSAVSSLLDTLSKHDLVLLDGERIVGAYPFTDGDSGHRVKLDGRSVNAMCAVDALGIGAMLDCDVAIESRCRHCGSPIRITTRIQGRALAAVDPQSAVVWLSGRYEGGCAASSLCAETAFFCTADHLAEWRRNRRDDVPGFGLSIEEALEVGRAIFGPILVGVEMVERARDSRDRGKDAPGRGSLRAGKQGSKAATCSTTKRHGHAFDLAVIGAGSAGFSAAIAAAERGARVALIGHGTIGGTCVNIGCVPSKTMIRAAETLHQAKTACRFRGIEAHAKIADWSAVMAEKRILAEGLRQAKYVDLLPAYDAVTYLEGRARLVNSGVCVDGDVVKAGKVIIATGSAPFLPPIVGLTDVPYLTSTTALELGHLPVSMIVIGGGVIGSELGQMFARMGTKVTLLCRSRLLPNGEPEISDALAGYLRDEGIDVVCGAAYKSIRKNGVLYLSYEHDGKQHEVLADEVLVATGRLPNSADLGLEQMGVELLRNGGIKVDDRMRTTRKGLYAAGDVTGRDMFVYMAAYGAKIAADNALNGDCRRYDNSVMPEVVFTDPQVATVGLTEAAAKAQGIAVRTSVLSLAYVPRALAARDTRGLIKLVADSNSKRLLGAHILAPEGADTIQTAALAIKHGMTADELGAMVFPYLTTVEGLKLAAQTFDKDVAKLSCCAG